ncbi:hypothetical protein [Mycoplasmopsis cynos]|uniref:hypothetical protein n=1 Tax=Mycoplasmopsis cynos TaxID=171284 RepID=UPI003A5C837D
MSHISSLTNVETKIFNFVNNYKNKEFNLTQSELSKNTLCSEASINRFAKKYGFDNYRLFAFFINNRLKEIDIFDNDLEKYLKNEKNLLDIYRSQKYAIDNAFQKENIHKMKKVSKFINNAKRVLLFENLVLVGGLSLNLLLILKKWRWCYIWVWFSYYVSIIGDLRKRWCYYLLNKRIKEFKSFLL